MKEYTLAEMRKLHTGFFFKNHRAGERYIKLKGNKVKIDRSRTHPVVYDRSPCINSIFQFNETDFSFRFVS